MTSKANEPVVEGTPEIRPVCESIESPGGSEPAVTAQTNGGTPPEALNNTSFETPTIADGTAVVSIASGPAIWMTKSRVAVRGGSDVSVNWTVTG